MRLQERKHEKELTKCQNKYNVLVGEFNELKDEIQNIITENKTLKKEVERLDKGKSSAPKPKASPRNARKPSPSRFDPTE